MTTVAKIFLIRHGTTDWAAAGRHTSRTDRPLSPEGARHAAGLREMLREIKFSRVLTSPLERARQTCELAGLAATAQLDPDLHEWDYGAYEGLTTAEIRAARPEWNLFHDGCPDGESVEQVAQRADRVLAGLRPAGGITAVFSHGHFLRALAMRWIDLPVSAGEHFAFDPAAVGVLGFEHAGSKIPALCQWNVGPAGLSLSGG